MTSLARSEAKRILVVAATEPELCGRSGLACGVGPVEAASATARALALDRPDAVLHVGLAGGRGLPAGSIVVGTEAVYADISAAIPVLSRLEPDPDLLSSVSRLLPDALALPIATSAAVGALQGAGTEGGAMVEAMEGFAVLRACELAGVPVVELRAISNEIGESDRRRWHVDVALDALARVLPILFADLTSTI
jgi:futalosine hydrolase